VVYGDDCVRLETVAAVLCRLGCAGFVVTVCELAGLAPGAGTGSGDVRGPLRRGLSKLFTRCVNLLSGHRLRYYNGPVLHPRGDVLRFATDCTGSAYQAELLVQQLDAGRSYVEVPMINQARGGGVTKAFRPRNLLSVARSLWRIRTRRFGAPSPSEPGASEPGPPERRS